MGNEEHPDAKWIADFNERQSVIGELLDATRKMRELMFRNHPEAERMFLELWEQTSEES